MLRKNIRLRKEYLFKKDKEIKERATSEKKQILKKALDEGKAIPFSLRKEAAELKHQLDNDDGNVEKGIDGTIVPRSHMDDEYEEAKYKDPKVLITTSRNPSSRLIQFQKV